MKIDPDINTLQDLLRRRARIEPDSPFVRLRDRALDLR